MLITAVPKLPFIAKQPTIDYYVTQLGFILQADYGDYLIMKRDETELHLFSFPTLKAEQSDFMVYIRVEGIEELYSTLMAKVPIHPNGALAVKPWQQKEFSLTDPNGTLLTFGEAVG